MSSVEEMPASFADRLVDHKDRHLIKAVVPEWQPIEPEGGFFIRPLTVAERDAWEVEALKPGADGKLSPVGIRARLVARCLCNKEGMLLIEPERWEVLQGKSAMAVNRLANLISLHSGLNQADLASLEKN